jgi:TonB family protein
VARLSPWLSACVLLSAAAGHAQDSPEPGDIDITEPVAPTGSVEQRAESSADVEPPESSAPSADNEPAPSAAASTDDLPAESSAAASIDDVPLQELVTRLEASLELQRLTEQERYEDALPVAARLLALTEEEFGSRSREAAEAHEQLARAQSRAGEHEQAERNFLSAVEIYRSVDGVFSPLAIEPLTGLGDNYQQSEQYLNAVSAYSEARTVSRRIFGLLNPGQIPIMDRMTVSLQSLDRGIEADQLQLEALQLVERTHEAGSPEILEGIYKYARWLRDNGRYQEERNQYARALRLIRDRYGENSDSLVTPLMGIGNSFRHQRIPEGQGIGALKDALVLLESQDRPDQLVLAEVLRDLGDWAVAFSKVGYDGADYRRAWRVLGQVEGGEDMRRRWFTGPEYVLREPISQRGLSEEEDALDGHVLVKFDLDESGRTDNVLVIESEPPGLKDESVLRHVRRSRFRPQMLDGDVVRGRELALQFTYRYDPDEVSSTD